MANPPELFIDTGALHAKMIKFILSRQNDDIDYALVMKVDEGYNFHYRLEQPCYGELRKYSMTHGTMCTRPESEKPDDLYFPFPKGIPYAIAVPFNHALHSTSRDNYLRALVSEDSPWISGFGSPDSVEFIEKNGHLTGFILKDMHVDHTVMVSLIWATCHVHGSSAFDRLITEGFSVKETLAILVMNSTYSPHKFIVETDDYHWGSRLSFKRFFEAKPRNFSGGMFDEGYDYNRRMIQDIFYSDTGLEWQAAVAEGGCGKRGWGSIFIDDTNRAQLVPAMKYALAKGFKEEEPLIEKPFATHAPVMNPGDVFMIDPIGWGNYETGDEVIDKLEDYEDDYDYESDDELGCLDPDCTICHPKIKGPTPWDAIKTVDKPFWVDLNQPLKGVKN